MQKVSCEERFERREIAPVNILLFSSFNYRPYTSSAAVVKA